MIRTIYQLFNLGNYNMFLTEIRKSFVHKIVNIFLPISFNLFFGTQKSCLIERVFTSAHNTCFG